MLFITITTIALKPETKELLRQLGEKGESYDEIIQDLIKEYNAKRVDKKWNKILEENEFISLNEL